MQTLRQPIAVFTVVSALVAGVLAYVHSRMTSKDPLADHGSAFLRTALATAAAVGVLAYVFSPKEAGASPAGAALEPFDPVPAAPAVSGV